MPKTSLMNRYHKLLLKVSVMTLVGLLGQSVFAACPELTEAPNQNIGRVSIPGSLIKETIYFCKQEFSKPQLSYEPKQTDIVPGGSKTVSMGSIEQIFPLNRSIDLLGFTPTDLKLNDSALSASFPNKNGYGGSPSLFNFYTRIVGSDCYDAVRGGNQYELIKGHLRENAYRFQANDGTKKGVRVYGNPNDIAIIEGVKVTESQSGKSLTADIALYHANLTGERSFRTFLGTYCWVGVGAKMEIKSLENVNAGDYVVDIGVFTD